jgi:phage terminase small subunit
MAPIIPGSHVVLQKGRQRVAKQSKKEASPRPLTPRERLFVERYLLCFNATQAAREAGYSERSAYAQGSRLLKRHEIKAAIESALSDRTLKNLELAEKVIQELALISMSDIVDVIDVRPTGSFLLRPLDQLKPEVRRLILEVSQTKTEYTDPQGVVHEVVEQKVKLHPKVAALQTLTRVLGLEAPTRVKQEVTGKDGKPIQAEVKSKGKLTDAVADMLVRKVLVGEREG